MEIPKKDKDTRKKEKAKRKTQKTTTKKPNDKYWRNKADDLFMSKGRGLPCAVCGITKGTVYHHIIEKSRCRAMRYDIKNVIPLCQAHHCHSNELAPHSRKSIAQHRWWDWFKKNHPEQYKYCKENEYISRKYTYKQKFEELSEEIS